jgi:hypothetical protein
MATYITFDELKMHLNIETGFTLDNQYCIALTKVVTTAVQNYVNNGLTGYTATTGFTCSDGNEYQITDVPDPVKQCCLLMAANLFANRSAVSFAQGNEVPYTLTFLLNPYRINAIV